MPSVSPKQARTMAGAAHDPAFAKKMGIPQSVAREFNQADKGGPMFSKGHAPKTASYAQGGEVLGRTRNFLKEQVEFRDPDEGNATADADQKYGKSGDGKGNGMVPAPKGKSKSLKAVKPR